MDDVAAMRGKFEAEADADVVVTIATDGAIGGAAQQNLGSSK